MLKEQDGACCVLLCALNHKILTRLSYLFQKVLRYCLAAAVCISLIPSTLIPANDVRCHFSICVNHNDFQICCRKFVVIIVVWKPVLLSEVRSVRKFVPIQLMAGIGLAMQDLSRVQVWAKSMWVVVAEVVVAIPVRDIQKQCRKMQELLEGYLA